jgi:hypothetical protein
MPLASVNSGTWERRDRQRFGRGRPSEVDANPIVRPHTNVARVVEWPAAWVRGTNRDLVGEDLTGVQRRGNELTSEAGLRGFRAVELDFGIFRHNELQVRGIVRWRRRLTRRRAGRRVEGIARPTHHKRRDGSAITAGIGQIGAISPSPVTAETVTTGTIP